MIPHEPMKRKQVFEHLTKTEKAILFAIGLSLVVVMGLLLWIAAQG